MMQLAVLVLLAVAAVACGSPTAPSADAPAAAAGGSSGRVQPAAVTPTSTATATPAPQVTRTPTAEPTPEPTATNSPTREPLRVWLAVPEPCEIYAPLTTHATYAGKLLTCVSGAPDKAKLSATFWTSQTGLAPMTLDLGEIGDGCNTVYFEWSTASTRPDGAGYQFLMFAARSGAQESETFRCAISYTPIRAAD